MATPSPPFPIPNGYKIAGIREWQQCKIPDFSDGQERTWPGKDKYRPSDETRYRTDLATFWNDARGIAHPGVAYYLDRLPKGYACFEIDQPNGTQVYKRLFGHPSGRFFDSILTFKPHFLWLMSGMAGNCECIRCKPRSSSTAFKPRSRPREPLDTTTNIRERRSRLAEDGERSSRSVSASASGLSSRRPQRQVQQANAPYALDEEGTEDVWKSCIKKLAGHKGGATGIEIDIEEKSSIDWMAERESLPKYLTQVDMQHSFTPRVGELVLWFPDFLDEHYLIRDPTTSEYKFYSFEQQCFHGFPAWRGGVVATVPSSTTQNGPVDFPDILYTPKKMTAFNTAGFRIETLPDSNDDYDKSLSKQYRYVPLRCIRPLSHWQLMLKGITREKIHSSIFHAISCTTSMSLVEKWRFNGDWPLARIFCKGLYLGSELITIGDSVRLLSPSTSHGASRCTDVLVVTSIRFVLDDIQEEHIHPQSPQLSNHSLILIVGNAYTTDIKRAYHAPLENVASTPSPVSLEDVKSTFRPVGAAEYGNWYLMHPPHLKYEVSHDQILGRMYEAGAMQLWSGQRQTPLPLDGSRAHLKPDLSFDIDGIRAARKYASDTDSRLDRPSNSTETGWYLADTRAQALGIATFNGIEVGKYHDIRTPATLRAWRAYLKIEDGHNIDADLLQQIAPTKVKNTKTSIEEAMGEYVGKARGRKPGAKLVDGKILYPGDPHYPSGGSGSRDAVIYDDEEHPEFNATPRAGKKKPSSQMAGAALVSSEDETDSVQNSYGNEQDDMVEEEEESHQSIRLGDASQMAVNDDDKNQTISNPSPARRRAPYIDEEDYTKDDSDDDQHHRGPATMRRRRQMPKQATKPIKTESSNATHQRHAPSASKGPFRHELKLPTSIDSDASNETDTLLASFTHPQTHPRTSLSKLQISERATVPGTVIVLSDSDAATTDADSEDDLEKYRFARGGTEESEGGDYRPV